MQLSTELKQGTKESHNAAENGKFIAGFLRGVLDEEQYKKLLGNFYYIYSAMELRFDKLKDDPVLGDLYFPELHRKKRTRKGSEVLLWSHLERTYLSFSCDSTIRSQN